MAKFTVFKKDEAKQNLADLVQRFEDTNQQIIDAPEADIEKNFIRPFFRRVLNWDVYGESRREQEFSAQFSTRKGKRPDYLLRPQDQHLLFVEAKKVKYDLHERVDYQWQVYQYAYSTQSNSLSRRVDFAVLTDFEEFLVLDCTFQVNRPEAVKQLGVFYWTFEQYLNVFDKLWDLFERDSLLRAARTRELGLKERKGLFAYHLSPRKAKARRIPPDKSFLIELDDKDDGWRIRLARDMKKLDPSLDGPTITAAVQLIINRLLFIKALSDRDIEDDYLSHLAELVEKAGLDHHETGWFEVCQKLFSRLNRFYNGSVFESRPELESVEISNRTIKEIIDELRPESSPYNFSSMPVEILGMVYEQFLGKTIELRGRGVKIAEKPEIRKAGGVYYTPQYVVQYIVENTIKAKLDKCKTPDEAAKLKILDPACGSGSFLLGAYDALISWHLTYYKKKKRLSKKDKMFARRNKAGEIRLTAKMKRTILLNNIFGVDIDQQACEVTRFSLSLKAVEDTTKNELDWERGLWKETIIPDLSENIKCGNSLIDSDYFENFENRQGGLRFSGPSDDELLRINAFDWSREFSSILKNEGFDVIIGNPPYRRERDHKHLMDDIAITSFGKKYKAPRMDLWYYFVHRGLELLSPRGLLSFIVNAYWVSGTGSEKLIKSLKEEAFIEEVFHLGKMKVFEKVSGQHMIIRLSKSQRDYTTVLFTQPDGEKSAEPFINGTGQCKVVKKTGRQLFHNSKIDLQPHLSGVLDQLSDFPKLSSVARVRQGIAENPPRVTKKQNENYGNRWDTGEGVFVLSGRELTGLKLPKNEMSLIRPYHTLRDIDRYHIREEPSEYLIYTTQDTCPDIRRFPKLYRHLKRFKPIMERRRETEKGTREWWQLHWPREEDIWEQPKIVALQMSERPSFAPTNNPLYINFSANVVVPDNNSEDMRHYIAALLNSRLIWLWFHHNAKRRGVGLEINGKVLQRVPIIVHDDKNTFKEIASLSRKMCHVMERAVNATGTQKARALERQFEKLDEELDQRIYDLYEIDGDGIRNVVDVTSS